MNRKAGTAFYFYAHVFGDGELHSHPFKATNTSTPGANLPTTMSLKIRRLTGLPSYLGTIRAERVRQSLKVRANGLTQTEGAPEAVKIATLIDTLADGLKW